MLRLPVVSALLGLVLLAAACGKSAPELPPISEFPAPGDPAKVVLQQAGTSPIQLRFAPVQGESSRVAMWMNMDMDIGIMGQSMDMSMDITSDLANTIDEVRADGSFVQRSLIENAKVKVGGDAAQAIPDTSMVSDMMNGQATIITMDPQGRVLGMEMPGGAAGQMMEQMGGGFDSALKGSGVAFPDQPVGIGAKWQTLSRIDMMGVKMRFVAEYELIELNGKVGKAALKMRGGIGDGEGGSLGSVPGGEIKSMSFEANGTVTFDLDHPTRSLLEIEMKMGAEMKAMDEEGTIELVLKMKVEPKV